MPPTESLPLYVKVMRNDPLAAFALGVHRVREEVPRYRATLIKRERVHGKLGEKEVVRVAGPGPSRSPC